MEERRKADDAFLEKFYKLLSDVDRLIDHERVDRLKYEKWYEDFSRQLIELGKMRLDLSNGRLTALENRPVVVQLTEKEIKAFFDQWSELLAGKLSFKFILSVAGTLSVILTALAVAAIGAYFGFRR